MQPNSAFPMVPFVPPRPLFNPHMGQFSMPALTASLNAPFGLARPSYQPNQHTQNQ